MLQNMIQAAIAKELGLDGSERQGVGFWELGKTYSVQTATRYHFGRLAAIDDRELVLEDAAWVQDTGRWHEWVKGFTPSNAEIEPEGTVLINRGAIIDAVQRDARSTEVK